ASVSQAATLLTILDKYKLFSGQMVNLHKSVVFFSRNTPQHLQDNICSTLQGITSHKSTRYLGLPLGIGRSKLEAFNF
ncbi:Unknown protein, partial [Striga hermonthica]